MLTPASATGLSLHFWVYRNATTPLAAAADQARLFSAQDATGGYAAVSLIADTVNGRNVPSVAISWPGCGGPSPGAAGATFGAIYSAPGTLTGASPPPPAPGKPSAPATPLPPNVPFPPPSPPPKYAASRIFGSPFAAGWHSVLVSFSFTGPATVLVDGVEWEPVRIGNIDTCPIQASAWPIASTTATTLAVGDGGPLGTGLASSVQSYTLGDVQIYSTAINALWTTGVDISAASNATLSPPPPYVALPGASRLAACKTAPPASRYGGVAAYPVIGDLALDFGTPGGNPATLVVPGRSLTLLGSLNFNVAKALDLGVMDFTSWTTLTVVLMSDSALCSSGPLLDMAGFNVAIVGASGNCATLGASTPLPQIAVYGPLGQQALLTGSNSSFITALPTAKANVYWAISFTATGTTVYYNGRVWATSDAVSVTDAIATERNVILGYGNLLDVQIYKDMAPTDIPVAMRKLALGLSGGC